MPLWAVLRGAVPGIVLPLPAAVREDAGLMPYRRVIEIRDGVLALRPYMPGGTAEGAATPAAGGPATVEQACVVAAAMRAASRSVSWAAGGERPWPCPDLDAEVAWLRRVSRLIG